MARTVTITNGSGTSNLINDTYSVTADVVGYDNTSILPASVEIVEGTDTYAFTIAATGTLTLHVTEDGTSAGTPIVGATFVRTDNAGTQYGEAITTNDNGDAIFNNVPFAESGAPAIYYRQTASDGNHEFDETLKNTTMTTDTQTVEVQNPLGASRTITLTDANYANLPIDNGSITLTN